MEKCTLLCALLNHLLHINAACIQNEEDTIRKFEERYCYDPKLQPMFTENYLSSVFHDNDPNIIYGIKDELGICLLLFSFQGKNFIVGPYINKEFDMISARNLLLKMKIPVSFLMSIQNYYSAFPILSTFQLRNTISACAKALSDPMPEYTYLMLRNPKVKGTVPADTFSETFDYDSLLNRYELENQFLRFIEQGDTENVMTAYREMNLQGLHQKRYVNSVYQDPMIGLSILRTLARKAAERGGASVIEINEITQRNVQRVLASHSMQEQVRHSMSMISELTEAVRRHRYLSEKYSAPVRKAVEYLNLNLSQKMELSELAHLVGLSEVYLTRLFKKEVGMTISQYVAGLRCSIAAGLLENRDIQIQEISSYVGYLDNNYFVKVFKAQYGMTPSEYRAKKR